MPPLVVCKSSGWTEAKQILLPPLPPSPISTQNSLFGWKAAFDTEACVHAERSVPPSDLPAFCLSLLRGELLRHSHGNPSPSLWPWDQMNRVSKVLKIIKKSSRRRRRWREELRVEEEGEGRELCDPGGLCHLHLCTGGKETGMLLLAQR